MNDRQTSSAGQGEAPAARRTDAPAHEAVAVDIYAQVYHLRGPDPGHITRLAQVVDGKMRAVASVGGGPGGSLRVAVLAARNIADELAALRARHEALAATLRQSQTAVRSRTGDLSHMLDEVLDERRAG